MCVPAAIAITSVISAVSMGLQIASVRESAKAQQRANERATDWALKQRALEMSQIQTSKNQKAQEAAIQDYETTLAGMEAMGNVSAQAGETGLTGNYLKAIARNVDMQTSRQRGQDTATYNWGQEAANLQIGAADFRAQKEIGLLPEIPSQGAAIAGAVIGGIAQGVSIGSNFKQEGASWGGWGFMPEGSS